MRTAASIPRRAALLLGAALFAAAGAAAPEGGSPSRFPLTRSSRFWLEGTTTVNRFKCLGDELEGAIVVDAPRARVLDALTRLEAPAGRGAWSPAEAIPEPRFRLEVPVAQLDCRHRGMERDLRQTLEADRYPTALFELIGVDRVTSSPAARDGALRHRVALSGALTLRERRRELSTTISAERTAPGRFRLTGTLPVRMSEFGIEPPVVLFGLIRVDDELSLLFDVEIEIGEEIVESPDGSVSPRAAQNWPLPLLAATPNHDFR